MPDHPVVITLDATFFARTDGLLVARAEGKNILWREIKTESIAKYEALLSDLVTAGMQFAGFIIDGRVGVKILLLKRFPDIPLQLCQFHQLQIVRRYLTSRPKLEAGKQLLKITYDMARCGLSRFTRKLFKWYRRWSVFLAEKTVGDGKQGWHYTHKKLRSAYRSLQGNLPYLFTYLSHTDIGMGKTTNSCDGSFAHLKQKVGIHRGLRRHRRQKMLNYFLENGVK